MKQQHHRDEDFVLEIGVKQGARRRGSCSSASPRKAIAPTPALTIKPLTSSPSPATAPSSTTIESPSSPLTSLLATSSQSPATVVDVEMEQRNEE
ncbi:conserved hypothetical protein [Ricinus communis]|uniref:Uncharacterized protein n=1 Tax=Ricinus communis TaxID=3988 RepID=B9S4Y2_RICCO|nr:conserved hypothetical protein [Ricinus communis]